MRRYLYILILCILFLSVTPTVRAIYDPISIPNNKFGIHIIDENDLENAAKLVNSSGGDWGYVTLVIREDDRNVEKWQKIFEKFSYYRLIPLVRLATILHGDTWAAAKIEEAEKWASFLSRLPWPINNRYVILFNEPNHAKEWGGYINPSEYAQILSTYSSKLKEESSDFFILPAGLDASAPNGRITMDEEKFIREMVKFRRDIFDHIDGWASHSYPNPGFRGTVNDFGRGSIKNYQWELSLLKSLGLDRDFPVFITETGWPHREGIPYSPHFYSLEEIALYIKEASETVWNDPRIAALTPFILNYQSYPFANFSWQKLNENTFYPQFDVYKKIDKIKGSPNLNIIPTPSLSLSKFLHHRESAYAHSRGVLQAFLVNVNNNIWKSLFSFIFKL